ncbi:MULTISPECIES: hypothetical protein [unclassified Bradyrhizobium]|uniref:hypothetical protein n=1 Tax=unclassified Bradyrhizobium TaxID=2631580 RepID=UPI00247A94A9|nr:MULTISPECIES: hypothetical protein [unclassified Bradyrhizobium]WGR74318.1 hypothetical protein MTX24_16470 [Bradyrhizobium sp. ISRA426]WGR79153.1 hypothetical protein MTX21_01585 [Bradyrhizobium sp. ISRA430]WGR90641.1 hypothetical protein MTX25_39730 [Bradyrhizobium sp. ISRA432]
MAKKNGGSPGPGHNSTLTDEEKRALTFHHAKAYEVADALVEKAKKDRSAVVDLAKADLGRGAKADIVDLLTANTPAKMKAVVERVQRLARWAGLPIGSQPQLFEPAPDQFENGKVAGMQGEKCEPPLSLPQDQFQMWIAGWHDGQTILMRAFAKKRKPAEPEQQPATDPAQMDLSERKDLDQNAVH